MRWLDPNHEVVGALARLLPEAIIAGGSFGNWLPHPRLLAPDERAHALASAQHYAIDQCIRTLLERVGLNAATPVSSGEGGAREWPVGFVGSLTHKGTVVLGGIAQTGAVKMIGIDLERTERDDLADIEAVVADDDLAPGMERGIARLLSFSAKEAVFKAQYAVSRRRLDFSDINLVWEVIGNQNLRAAVMSPVEGLMIRAALVGKWVVSAALSTTTTGT